MSFKNIFILIGPPGSGKSTYASIFLKDKKIISSDDVRENYFGYNYSDEIENWVFNSILKQTIDFIKENKDVVLDTTYFNSASNRETLFRLLRRHSHIKIRVIAIYFDIKLEEVLKRNKRRNLSRVLDENIVKRLFYELEEPLEKEFCFVIKIKDS